MAGLMPAGLALGGPMPANASGGGSGTLTNVWVNGRELHPYDVMQLQQLVGQVYQGRWWVDAQGNFGQEGGAALGNLYALSQQRSNSGGGGDSYYSRDQNGSVFVGGGCGVYEGTVVRERAVLAAGVVLTRSTRVYDLVNERVIAAGPGESLEIPAGAVVVPGTRTVDTPFGREHGLSAAAMLIVKYRDARTDAATTLEGALR